MDLVLNDQKHVEEKRLSHSRKNLTKIDSCLNHNTCQAAEAQ